MSEENLVYIECPQERCYCFGKRDPSGVDCPHIRDCMAEPQINENKPIKSEEQ